MDEIPTPPKTFTLDEAHALLPKVRTLIEQLQGLQRSIIETNAQVEEMSRKVSSGNGYPIQSLKQQIKDLTKQQLKLIEGFQSALKQLEEMGCVLKDVATGLIDFYSVRNGEMIFLCWKLGEERIRFWHTLEEGYPGRQPLDEPA